MLKIEKHDWNDQAAELSSFRVRRQPGRGLLGEGKADVAFFYKNNEKKQAVYGSEEEVFEQCRKIIATKKNPAEAIKMQKEFQDVWSKSHYHGTEESTHAQRDLKKAIELINKSFGKKEEKKLSKDVNKVISDQFYGSTPPKLMKFKIQEKGTNIKDFAAKVSEKNKSSVYHHFSGERKVSREVAVEYANIFSKDSYCDPVDLMFEKKTIPVWAKANLLKVEELEDTYIPGRLFSYVANEKNAERVVVPRDIYQEDIKAIKFESKGSMYNGMVAFYYRATSKDNNCHNKLCVVGVEVPVGPVEFTNDTETQYYFGLYENVKGQSNLLNPDPYHKQDNEYILKNFNPTTLAPIVSLVNPEVIQDRTDYKKAIPQSALIREEERLMAHVARLEAEKVTQAAQIEKGTRFVKEHEALQKQINDFTIRVKEMQYQIEKATEEKHMNIFEKTASDHEKILDKLNPLRKLGRR